jgi:hypothetical protein
MGKIVKGILGRGVIDPSVTLRMTGVGGRVHRVPLSRWDPSTTAYASAQDDTGVPYSFGRTLPQG